MADSRTPHSATRRVDEGTPSARVDVERANRALAAQAGLPDGPNAGPSPHEHQVAQGPVAAAGTAGATADADRVGELPQEPEPEAEAEASPEEQELVDEQRGRDRDASRKADPTAR